MDYEWYTSADEACLEIDLDRQTEEHQEDNLGNSDEDDVIENCRSHTLESPQAKDDPSEPTNDSESVPSRADKLITEKGNVACVVLDKKHDSTDASQNEEGSDGSCGEGGCRLQTKTVMCENSDKGNNVSSDSQMLVTQEDISSSQGGGCHLQTKTVMCENSDKEINGSSDSQMLVTQEDISCSQGDENACTELTHDDIVEKAEEKDGRQSHDSDGSSAHKETPTRTSKVKCESQSIASLGIQNSIIDVEIVPDVTFDKSSCGAEDEPFKKEDKQNKSTHPCSAEEILTVMSENSDTENNGSSDSKMFVTQEDTSCSQDDEDACSELTHNDSVGHCINVETVEKDGRQSSDHDSSSAYREIPTRTSKFKCDSPPAASLDTDENTQNSIIDIEIVPEVTFDKSSCVLEEETFKKEDKQNDRTHPYSEEEILTVVNENSDKENNGSFDSKIPVTQEDISITHNDSVDHCINVEAAEENDDRHSSDSDGSSAHRETPIRQSKLKYESSSVASLDTNENSQNSIIDVEIVPGVTSDKSSCGFEDEPLKKNNEHHDSTHPWSEEEILSKGEDKINDDMKDSMSTNSVQRHSFSHEKKQKQEETETVSEEVLIDLLSEESYSERVEEDIPQPLKKNKKKAASKKLKKKRKKLKKGKSKKIHCEQKNEAVVEDQRFVKISGDQQSLESAEEGELEGEAGDLVCRKSVGERVSVDLNDHVLGEEARNQQEDEEREPGEIVEGKKKRKKKAKKMKKKKKRRRKVATIEEGDQDNDNSQRFPTYLDVFFLQDAEGEDEFDEILENTSTSFESDGRRTFQRGSKIYRRHLSSESEESVGSFDRNRKYIDGLDIQSEEPVHRRTRRRDQNGRDSGYRRQLEMRNSRDLWHRKEHYYVAQDDKDREHEYDRELSLSERDREGMRVIRERGHERDKNVVRIRNNDTRRVVVDERRQHPTRSASHERERRSGTRERVSRTRPGGHSARHRHKSRSREQSSDRERERGRERSKHKHKNRSRVRETSKGVRQSSQSRNSHYRSERAGSDKENNEEAHRRSRQKRTHDDSESDDRRRRGTREQERNSSPSSSSSVSSNSVPRRRNNSHHQIFISDNSSDVSDVILLETEKIVISIDEEEGPTHFNVEDDIVIVIDGESTQPLAKQSGSLRGNAQISPGEPEAEDVSDQSEEQGNDAAFVRDEHTEKVQGHPHNNLKPAADYDPAHPTEEAEELEIRSLAPGSDSSPVPLVEQIPVPPDHPPPKEVRPSTPPLPSLVKANAVLSQSQCPPQLGFEGPMSQMTFVPPFQQQPPPPPPPQPQQQSSLLSFPESPNGGLGQVQIFPPGPFVNGPGSSMLHLNSGLPPRFSTAQGSLLRTPDTRLLFPSENSSLPIPFRSPLPFRSPILNFSQLPPPRGSVPQQLRAVQHQMPVFTMAQLRSLLSAGEKPALAAYRGEESMPQPPQMSRCPLPVVTLQPPFMDKSPLVNNSPFNMTSGSLQPSRDLNGSNHMELTEEVDMDMSPGGVDEPDKSDSDRNYKRRKRHKSHTKIVQAISSVDSSKPSSGTEIAVTQPVIRGKTLSKNTDKLTPKKQLQVSSPSHFAQDRSDLQPGKKIRIEINDDDDMPASAVDLTNKEKYMKKLHFQERVIDEVKMSIKPFYISKKITKEQYKIILRKAVPKVCHNKRGNINPQKIQHLVEAYVKKINKGHSVGGGGKKKKQHSRQGSRYTIPASVRKNEERAKGSTR